MELVGRMDEMGRVWLPSLSEATEPKRHWKQCGFGIYRCCHPSCRNRSTPLDWNSTAFQSLELADGREQMFFTFFATAIVGDLEVPVDIIVTERGTPLMGTALLQTLEGHLSVRFDEGTVTLSVPSS